MTPTGPGVRLSILFAMSLAVSATASLVRSPGAYSMELERARFLYDIEGDSDDAMKVLKSLVASRPMAPLASQALLMIGIIFDESGRPDSAEFYCKRALREGSLPRDLTLKAYRILARVSPESVKPVTVRQGDPFQVLASYPIPGDNGREYILECATIGSGQALRGLYRMDSQGRMYRLSTAIRDDERLFDAVEGAYLMGDSESIRWGHFDEMDEVVLDYRDFSKGRRVDNAFFLSESGGDFAVMFGRQIDYYQGGKFRRSVFHEGEECHWTPLRRHADRGFLHCGGSGISSLDIPLGTSFDLDGNFKSLVAIHPYEQACLFQFEDRIELRSSPGYGTVIWRSPASATDQVHVTENGLWVLDDKGTLSRLQVLTGSLLFKKDLFGKRLYPMNRELYVDTYFNAIQAIHPEGGVQWTYEYGWDSDVTFLFADRNAVLLHADGKRILLNLDLMQFSQPADLAADGATHSPSPLAAPTVDKLLEREPGNGMAWQSRYRNLSRSRAPINQRRAALVLAARSYKTPYWTNSPLLEEMARLFDAQWIWKRVYGPRYIPYLDGCGDVLVYLESNNQTLVLLDAVGGNPLATVHVPEELDSRIFHCSSAGVYATSPHALYYLPMGKNATDIRRIPLPRPACGFSLLGGNLYISDWSGNVFCYPTQGDGDIESRWVKNLGTSGILLAADTNTQRLAGVSIQGIYYSIDPENARIIDQIALPAGTVTGIHAAHGRLFAGYDDGTLVCVSLGEGGILWNRSLQNQIFSLDSDGDSRLILTTSSKTIYVFNAETGQIISQSEISASLINKPVIQDGHYWLGTMEPALEKRRFDHSLVEKFLLPGIPGNPRIFGSRVIISTLDGFILAFES